MTDQITVPRETWDALREALKLCYEHCRVYHPEVDTNNVGQSVRQALTAANAVSEPVGINGLTEAETSASMSVMGLSKPQAPYANCRFRICDLPGQCKGEGKCHHPAVAQAQGEAWVWNPASTEWEKVRAFGHWQQCAIYAFGSTQPEPLAHPQATEPASCHQTGVCVRSGLAAENHARLIECARRLVEHADFALGGILSADSKAKDIPSKAVSQVKSHHLAALRDALPAAPEAKQ